MLTRKRAVLKRQTPREKKKDTVLRNGITLIRSKKKLYSHNRVMQYVKFVRTN